MTEAHIQFFKETGNRNTTEEAAVYPTKNKEQYLIDAAEMCNMEYGGHVTMIDPDYLEWLEGKVETFLKIVNAIKPELNNIKG